MSPAGGQAEVEERLNPNTMKKLLVVVGPLHGLEGVHWGLMTPFVFVLNKLE